MAPHAGFIDRRDIVHVFPRTRTSSSLPPPPPPPPCTTTATSTRAVPHHGYGWPSMSAWCARFSRCPWCQLAVMLLSTPQIKKKRTEAGARTTRGCWSSRCPQVLDTGWHGHHRRRRTPARGKYHAPMPPPHPFGQARALLPRRLPPPPSNNRTAKVVCHHVVLGRVGTHVCVCAAQRRL